MNAEIKELLGYIDQFVYVDQTYDDIKLSKIDSKLLLDYITNLQEQLHQASLDIQELTERDIECPSWCDKLTNLQHTEDLYNQLLKDYDELQQRIEKAVNILKEHDRLYGILHNDWHECFILHVIDILNGKE